MESSALDAILTGWNQAAAFVGLPPLQFLVVVGMLFAGMLAKWQFQHSHHHDHDHDH
jgi:hypothetical protein